MAKREFLLVDTNIIIHIFRQNKEVKELVDSFVDLQLCISEITYLEIITGCNTIEKRNESEYKLETYNLISITSSTIEKAKSLIKRYTITSFKLNKKSISIADIIIAACAIENNLELLTYNKKDFEFIKELKIHEFSK